MIIIIISIIQIVNTLDCDISNSKRVYPQYNTTVIDNYMTFYWGDLQNNEYRIIGIEIKKCSSFAILFDHQPRDLQYEVNFVEIHFNETSSSTTASIDDYFIISLDSQRNDSFQNSSIISDVTCFNNNDTYYIQFNKLWKDDLEIANQTYEYDYLQLQSMNLSYIMDCYSTNLQLGRNHNRGGFIVSNFNPPSIITQVDKWRQFVMTGHGIFLFIFWGILSDIGVFFARQMRSYPKYAKVHGMIFQFQSLITYIFYFSMIAFNKKEIQQINFYDDLRISHFTIGTIVVALITIQLLIGFLVKNNLESFHGTEKVYRIKIIHRVFGYTIYILTKIQVAIGVEIHVESFRLVFLFYAYYILLLLLKITIELLYYYEISLYPRSRQTFHYIEVDKNQTYENLVQKINQLGKYIVYNQKKQIVPRQQIIQEFNGLNYIILRDAVYDITDFNHPGGQYIMEAITGKEVGRYFYGGSPIHNVKMNLHRHSAFAINYIETRYIGDFRNEQCPMLYIEENQALPLDKNVWKYQEHKKIADDICLFRFSSDYFQVRQSLKGVQWLGRYFYIKPFGTGIDLAERPYSAVSCLSLINIQRRQLIMDYFKQLVIENDINIKPPQIASIFSNELQFVIKKHQQSQNMSGFLHGTSHKPYEITGPYGFGLELQSNSEGVHYAFVNGTGVIPFLDLIDFLLRKIVYTILIDQRGREVAEFTNYCEEDFKNTLQPNFQFILYGSFQSEQHFVGSQLAQDLLFLCRTFNLPFFDMQISFGQRFDTSYIKNALKFKFTKIYVVGSPQFEEQVLDNLRVLGIPRKLIINI